jgi:hypothetical protein
MIKKMQAGQDTAVDGKEEVEAETKKENFSNEEDIGNMNVEEDFDFSAI